LLSDETEIIMYLNHSYLVYKIKKHTAKQSNFIIDGNNFIAYFPQAVAKRPYELYRKRRVVISVIDFQGEIGGY
jgi:hypothetical protein